MSQKIKIERLQRRLLQLEPLEFIGVVRLLGIGLMEGEEPKLFEQMYADVLEKYGKLSRRQRQNFDQILKAATQKKDDSNDKESK